MTTSFARRTRSFLVLLAIGILATSTLPAARPFAADSLDKVASGDPNADPSNNPKKQTKARAEFEEKLAVWHEVSKEFWDGMITFHTGEGDTTRKEQLEWAEHEMKMRDAMDETLLAGARLLDEQPEDPEMRVFISRAILHRGMLDWYEVTKEAAVSLLGIGIDDYELTSFAGVAAVATGDFETAKEVLPKAVEQAQGKELGGISERAIMLNYSLDKHREAWEAEQAIRKREAEANDLPRVVLRTTRGEVVVELYENEAPNTVANFISLVEDGFYDNVPFYQVVANEYAQTGDPNGDGSGNAGYHLADEASGERAMLRGTLVMAKVPHPAAEHDPKAPRTFPNSASCQFLIPLLPFDPSFKELTCFGRVIEGMSAISTLNRVSVEDKKDATSALPDLIIEAEVIRKRDHEYKPETISHR